MATKPNKENIITEILILLEKGISYTECIKVIQSKSKLVESTFASYWKIANQRHLEVQQATQKAIAEQSTVNDIERLKIGILNKTEALKILTEIAKEPLKESAMGMVSAKTEQISAIKTISELQGWNSPIKTDNTNVNLNSELSKEDIDKLAKSLNEKY
jgi:hypothetical protein